MQPYSVKIDAFEGPLDLLLHLIQQAEVDIYDIPVAEITAQYLQYVHTMQELELDVASEYLVMAATLLAIKSQMLLPQQEEGFDEELEEEREQEDPRQELVERLAEYKRYKEAAQELKEREQERGEMYSKTPTELEKFSDTQADVSTSIDGVSLYDMLAAYQKMQERIRYKQPRTTKVKAEELSLEERMEDILREVKAKPGPTKFTELFQTPQRSYMVVSFLALLELMKTHSVKCIQGANFEDIFIYESKGAS